MSANGFRGEREVLGRKRQLGKQHAIQSRRESGHTSQWVLLTVEQVLDFFPDVRNALSRIGEQTIAAWKIRFEIGELRGFYLLRPRHEKEIQIRLVVDRRSA